MIKQNKGRSSEGMDILIHPSQTGCQKEKKILARTFVKIFCIWYLVFNFLRPFWFQWFQETNWIKFIGLAGFLSFLWSFHCRNVKSLIKKNPLSLSVVIINYFQIPLHWVMNLFATFPLIPWRKLVHPRTPPAIGQVQFCAAFHIWSAVAGVSQRFTWCKVPAKAVERRDVLSPAR